MRFAIGLDLGGTNLKAGLVTRGGEIEAFTKRPSRVAESAEAPIEAIVECVTGLRAQAGEAIAAVGFGAPGVIDPSSGGQVGSTPHLPHWRSFPLRQRLEAVLELPVAVDNDANLAALAESTLGAARGAKVALMVAVGTGVGCGIVIDGRVFRGGSGGAGEIGHLPLDGRFPCGCGVPGCVEPEAAGEGVARRARAAGLAIRDAEEVVALADRRDAVAVDIIARMCDRLGASIAAAINLFNPDVVVIGGGMSQAGEEFLEGLRSAVARYALPSHLQDVRIVTAGLGERAGVAGAGLLAWEAFANASRAGSARAGERSGPSPRRTR